MYFDHEENMIALLRSKIPPEEIDTREAQRIFQNKPRETA